MSCLLVWEISPLHAWELVTEPSTGLGSHHAQQNSTWSSSCFYRPVVHSPHSFQLSFKKVNWVVRTSVSIILPCLKLPNVFYDLVLSWACLIPLCPWPIFSDPACLPTIDKNISASLPPAFPWLSPFLQCASPDIPITGSFLVSRDQSKCCLQVPSECSYSLTSHSISFAWLSLPSLLKNKLYENSGLVSLWQTTESAPRMRPCCCTS